MKRALKEVRNLKEPQVDTDYFNEYFLVVRLIGDAKANKQPTYKRLMLIYDPVDENQWYLHVSALPGGMLTVYAGGIPYIMYRGYPYVSLLAIEKETREKLDNIRAIALKNIAAILRDHTTSPTEATQWHAKS